MANFEAKIRTSYTDIDGLVLDCRHSDLADDGSLWINRAPPARPLFRGSHDGSNNASNLFDSSLSLRADQLVGMIAYNVTDGSLGVVTSNSENEVVATLSGGTDNDWDADDEYVITTPRFGNPYQDVAAKQPVVSTVGGYQQAAFTRTNESCFKIPLAYDFPAKLWTVGFEIEKGANTDNDQVILGFPNFEIYRRNGSGNYGYWYSGGSFQGGSGDLPDGTWIFSSLSASTMDAYKNGVSQFSGSMAAEAIAAADPCGYIGDAYAGSKACDMILRGMQIWNRQVAPLEIDFAFQSLSPEFDYAVENRGSCVRTAWTDNTLTVPRINPNRAAPHRFILAAIPSDNFRHRVQIVAMINGVVLPDADLGGDLFDLIPMEVPSSNPPVFQDSGWSSVFDVAVDEEGHYTYLLYRQNGGSVVVHFDVEFAA